MGMRRGRFRNGRRGKHSQKGATTREVAKGVLKGGEEGWGKCVPYGLAREGSNGEGGDPRAFCIGRKMKEKK